MDLKFQLEVSVTVADKQISHIKGADLRNARQEISMIFQHFNLLWSRTVRENIAFPLEIAGIPKRKRQQRVNELIKLSRIRGKRRFLSFSAKWWSKTKGRDC